VGVKKERKRRLVKRKKTEHKEEKTKKQKEWKKTKEKRNVPWWDIKVKVSMYINTTQWRCTRRLEVPLYTRWI
jgi:hypothetical protein